MHLLENLTLGFQHILLDPIIILYCFLGVSGGVIIGALPGLGPSAGIAILLPLTYGMNPTAGIAMLAGIYYGAMYGGSITSILINTPGESASIVTTFDGYPLARKGKAGQALGMAAFASVIGGTVSVIAFMFLAPYVSLLALSFSPAEYLALMILGLTSIAGMTGKSVAKGFLSLFIGVFISAIGLDLFDGSPRFVYGNENLYGGISFIPVAMGLFGITEIILSQEGGTQIDVSRETTKFKNLLPSRQDWKLCIPHISRGSIIGFFIGILPGAGATIASFLSYDVAKRISKRRDLFGTGILEGIAAPESANNAASIGAMLPMLTLGVPGSGATAVMLGALVMFNMKPGPFLFIKNPEFAWGLVASMYLGNVILLILAIIGLPLFVKIIKVRPSILNAIVIGLIILGSYALSNSMFDVGVAVLFGAIGYIFKKVEIPSAPLVMALVLSYITEMNLRQAMTISRGDVFSIISRPIVAVILIICVGMIFGGPLTDFIKRSLMKRKERNSVS